MNMKTKLAVIVGTIILLAVHVFWWISLALHDFAWMSMVLLWTAPFVVSFILVRATQGKRLVQIVLLTASASALFSTTLNAIHQGLGNASDFSGYRGALLLFCAMLVFNLAVSVVGVICGKFALTSSKSRKPK